MGKRIGSNANDDMKYVRNNLYGYGYLEEQYLAPTKNMNDIEDDINDIIDVNDEQSGQIQDLAEQVDSIIAHYGGIAINKIQLVFEDDKGNHGFFLRFDYTITDIEGHKTDVSLYANVEELEDVYKAGDGISVESGDSGFTISVVIPENDYIEVSESGITTNGLNAKIAEIDKKVAAVNPGLGLITHNTGEMAVGNYNVSVEGETIFSVGNGTSDENRSNAFEVKSDGTVWMNVEGDYMEIGRLLSMLAHETY